LKYRFDKNTKGIVQYLDGQKSAENDKSSDFYMFLRIVQQVALYDGKKILEATQKMQILNEDSTDSDRKLDLVSKTKHKYDKKKSWILL
jgi:hypothetical protein